MPEDTFIKSALTFVGPPLADAAEGKEIRVNFPITPMGGLGLTIAKGCFVSI